MDALSCGAGHTRKCYCRVDMSVVDHPDLAVFTSDKSTLINQKGGRIGTSVAHQT
jgi:hypothetical protein